jgi:lon-related putative ATP-dependent protease
MPGLPPLTPDALRRNCDPETFDFETTEELTALKSIVGQDRAVQAIRFGIGIANQGYNLFALGSPGVGKFSVIRRFLQTQASRRPTPPDLAYLYNFKEPNRPKAVSLPYGRGAPFKKEMERLITRLRTAIPAAFEAEDYRARRQELEARYKARHQEAFGAIEKEARANGAALIRTPAGFGFAPIKNGEVLGPEDFHKLPEAEQDAARAAMERMQEKLSAAARQFPAIEREAEEKLKDLNHAVAERAVGPLFEEIRGAYADLPPVLAHIDEVRADLLENIEGFLIPEAAEDGPPDRAAPRERPGARMLQRYGVNLIVDNCGRSGAPVIYEDNPNLQSLLGRIEHVSQFGTLVTDFSLIQAGALHRANGGYLILDARKVLLAPLTWETLKRALGSREIKMENSGQVPSVSTIVSLDPEPIALDVKVVLIGEAELYYLLAARDPDFDDLFKVAVDFDDTMDRTGEAEQLFARLIADLTRHNRCRPLDRPAMARLVEHASRLAGDAGKITVNLRAITDLLTESDYWAGMVGRSVIAVADVERAIDARINRSDRLRDRSYEQILNKTILIDTKGAAVGQINGLSVLQLGSFAFGRPTRITARVRMGKGEVVDIEREVALGGPIHSKGVLILEGFLRGRYCLDKPLTLAASVVFEQSYGGVEGDSASSAELYALLSTLAETPIRQSFAVTGSVNQMGQVQAIGGVNEKIEGFFDICKGDGLTGEQGVLIPIANVRNLMLRHDIVEAVRSGHFRIFAVSTIDEGIALLTGTAAGARGDDGRFPRDSINGRVERRLNDFAATARAFARAGNEG